MNPYTSALDRYAAGLYAPTPDPAPADQDDGPYNPVLPGPVFSYELIGAPAPDLTPRWNPMREAPPPTAYAAQAQLRAARDPRASAGVTVSRAVSMNRSVQEVIPV